MATWMLITVSCLYFLTGVSKAVDGQWWWFLFWTCYATANIAWLKAT